MSTNISAYLGAYANENDFNNACRTGNENFFLQRKRVAREGESERGKEEERAKFWSQHKLMQSETRCCQQFAQSTKGFAV